MKIISPCSCVWHLVGSSAQCAQTEALSLRQAGDLLKPEPSPAPEIPERMSGPKTGPTLPSVDPLTTTTEGSGAPLTPDANTQTPQQTDTAQVGLSAEGCYWKPCV